MYDMAEMMLCLDTFHCMYAPNPHARKIIPFEMNAVARVVGMRDRHHGNCLP